MLDMKMLAEVIREWPLRSGNLKQNWKDKEELTGWRKVLSRTTDDLGRGHGTFVGVRALALMSSAAHGRQEGAWREGRIRLASAFPSLDLTVEARH